VKQCAIAVNNMMNWSFSIIGYMGDGFYRSKKLYQQQRSTDGKGYKWKPQKAKNKIHAL